MSNTLSREELVAIVTKHYQVSAEEAADKTDDELLYLVNQLQLPAAAEPAPAKAEKVGKASKAKPSVEQRYKITIHEQDGPDGHEDVPIGVQGKVALVKREHEVLLTDEQIEVLRNAVYRRYEPLANKPGEYTIRDVRRYNFSNMGPA